MEIVIKHVRIIVKERMLNYKGIIFSIRYGKYKNMKKTLIVKLIKSAHPTMNIF